MRIEPERPTYRSDIDGLRAVAVGLVLLFHLQLSRFGSGGYIGVDVFFVISGYLITGHLYRDLKAGYRGILEFYRRRIIRIFPALFVVYTACVLTELALRFVPQLHTFRWSLLSSVYFVSNQYLYATTGYFDFAARSNPLTHTWSLSIEEQFYILLPLLLLLLVRLRVGAQMAILSLLCVVSFVASELVLKGQPRASFYWVPLRAWELLGGSLLSFGSLPFLRRRWAAETASAAGMILIAGAALMLNHNSPFPGLNAVPPVIGAMLVLSAGEQHRTIASRLLSVAPVRFGGQISYSLYLWHWPLIVYQSYAAPFGGLAGKLAMLALSVVLATLSWALVEQPIRRRGKRIGVARALTAAIGAMLIMTVVALALPSISSLIWRRDVRAEATLALLDTYDPTPFMRPGICFSTTEQKGFDPKRCLALDPVRSNVLVMGDSHAADRWYGLARAYPGVNFLQATKASCTPVDSLGDPQCTTFWISVFDDFLAHNRVDAILLSGRWNDRMLAKLPAALARLRLRAPRVLLMGPGPEFSLPFPEIAARAIFRGNPAVAMRYLEPGTRTLDARMELIARQSGVGYISVYRLLCPSACTMRDAAGKLIMFDNDHLTPAGATLLAKAMPKTLFDLPETAIH